MPALLTSMFSPPNDDTVFAMDARTWFSRATSQAIAIARPPFAEISRAVVLAALGSSSTTATRAPSAANRNAIPLPMPEPAPEIHATFSFASLRLDRFHQCLDAAEPSMMSIGKTLEKFFCPRIILVAHTMNTGRLLFRVGIELFFQHLDVRKDFRRAPRAHPGRTGSAAADPAATLFLDLGRQSLACALFVLLFDLFLQSLDSFLALLFLDRGQLE